MFFVLAYVIFVQYSKVAQRTFEIVQKSGSREHGDIINYIDKNVECTSTAHARPETSTCEVLRDVSRKLQLTLCDNGVVEVSLLHV